MEKFVTDDDLFGLLDELNEQEAANPQENTEADSEMEASRRRYDEIIRKHKMN